MKDAPVDYSVYIVACADGTLYCGIARDVAARVLQHNSCKAGARYTKARRPVRLVYEAPCGSRSQALREEIRIKKLPRVEKDRLVATGRCEIALID
ncbi:MAG: GIY-YIG nuclease family protein [Alphaproteobacteria bacterium]|nr:GIY-YIG nuclease family protein [Alphaproteobacteria bacterium]